MEHTIRRRARGRKSKERKLKGVVEVPNFSGWCAGVGVYEWRAEVRNPIYTAIGDGYRVANIFRCEGQC